MPALLSIAPVAAFVAAVLRWAAPMVLVIWARDTRVWFVSDAVAVSFRPCLDGDGELAPASRRRLLRCLREPLQLLQAEYGWQLLNSCCFR